MGEIIDPRAAWGASFSVSLPGWYHPPSQGDFVRRGDVDEG